MNACVKHGGPGKPYVEAELSLFRLVTRNDVDVLLLVRLLCCRQCGRAPAVDAALSKRFRAGTVFMLPRVRGLEAARLPPRKGRHVRVVAEANNVDGSIDEVTAYASLLGLLVPWY